MDAINHPPVAAEVTRQDFSSSSFPSLPSVKRETSGSLSEFASLPISVRAEVDSWRREFNRLQIVNGRVQNLTKCLEDIATRMGVAYPTARRKWDAYKVNRDWRTLINRTKAGLYSDKLSEETIELWRKLCEKYQRNCGAAYRELCRRWFSGEEIPGLLPREPGATSMPKGCSYDNLIRHKPTDFELKVMRIGLGKAISDHAPKVFTTRVGLWVGSHFMPDDLWHDNFVTFRNKPVRVLEFGMLDLFSACRFAWGCKPRTVDEKGKADGLKEKQMRFLLASCLHQHGYSERGTEFIVEHGTAAIREDIAQLLYDRTGGLITVRRSGMTCEEQAVAGMYLGQGKGNPRSKGALESHHNLMHNELASLPAQTGKDVDHRPEHLHGLLRHCTDLAEVAQRLSPERARLLRFPAIEYSQFLLLISEVYEKIINGRTKHALEGWVELGFKVLEYRLSPTSDDWLSPDQYLALPDETKTIIGSLVRASFQNPGQPAWTRERLLSPREVFNRYHPTLKKIPGFVVAELLGKDEAVARPVRNGYIAVEDSEISSELIRFESRITTEDGSELELRDGEKFETFINPFCPTELFVHDAKLRYLGTARRDDRPCRNDHEALQRKFGRVQKRVAEFLTPVRARHSDITRARIADDQHNAAVASGRPVTREEKAAAEELKGALREIEISDDLPSPVIEAAPAPSDDSFTPVDF